MIREDLDKNIDAWGFDKGIATYGTQIAQAVKTQEELTEMFDAILKGDEKALKDAIGDIYVTLRMQCLVSDLWFDDCIEQAYNEIKDRKGHLRPDGTFVKEG